MLRGGYRLPFRLFGIPVRLDATFVLLVLLLTWIVGTRVGLYVDLFDLQIDSAALQTGATPWLLGLASALGLVLSVLIHELAHALTARRYGVEIKEITLWILGGVAQFREMPRRPGAEAVVAIVGPLASLLLGGLFWAIARALDATASGGALFVASYLSVINVILAFFNLLPALPMDGGRVLRSLLAMRTSYLQATRTAARVSRVTAVLMGIYGFLTLNLFLIAIAFFIYMAVQAETQFATVSQALEDIRVAELMTGDVVTVGPGMSIAELMRFMFRHKHLSYPVVGIDGEVVGMVTLRHAQGADEDAVVADVMSREVGRIAEQESAVEAFKRILETDSRRLIVVDAQGRMSGILSSTDLVRAVQIRMAGREVAADVIPTGAMGER